MVAYAKRNAALATTVGAILISILLIIFFGAWAVAASSEADFSRVLSGAAAGFSGSVAPTSAQSGQLTAATDPDNVPRLATDARGDDTAADKWWGKALLGACPLH